jgi:protein SCO1
MKKAVLFFIFTVLFSAACQRSQTQNQNASAEAKSYDLKGKVVAVDREKKKATIAHNEIPGFMPAMTMDFPIKDDWVWDDLTKDSEIRAKLIVDKDVYWLENLGIIASPNPNQPVPPINENFAQVGKEIPAFTLTNQDSKRFSLRDYRGKALAITFIYTKCPLPNYCILMSRNFSDLANQIDGDAGLKDKIRLLSISFDPKTDTPETLKQYGLGYLGKDSKAGFTVWQLAVGSEKEVKDVADFFGLFYKTDEQDAEQFNHSLRTAVIAPDGKVTKIFSGNEWTTKDLLREMEATLK